MGVDKDKWIRTRFEGVTETGVQLPSSGFKNYLQEFLDLHIMRDDLTKPEPLILSQDRRNVVIIGVATTDAERRRSVKNSDQNVKIVAHVRRLCHVVLLLLLL